MRGLTRLAAAAIAAIALPLLALPAAAQTQLLHIRGQVQSLDGGALVITSRTGEPVTIKLAPKWGVSVVKTVDVSAIQPGSFIGTSEVDRPDGSGQSLEVHVFPPGVKMGEGHYPWDLQPHSNMTNGTVGTVVASGGGRAIDVSYPNGTRHIVVPAGVPIVAIGLGDPTMIKPGVGVFIMAVKLPDGSLASNNVTVGVNGAAPPM